MRWLDLRMPLAAKAEERIDKPVLAAVVFTVTNHPPAEYRGVLAVTLWRVYLLDCRVSFLGVQIDGVREHYSRDGLLTRWERGRLRVAAQLSWPDSPSHGYIAGWTRTSPEADKLFGLLTTGEFEHVLGDDA